MGPEYTNRHGKEQTHMTTVQAQISLNEAYIKAMAYNPHLEISPEHDVFDAVLNMITGV